MRPFVQDLRQHLARADALVALSLLGIVAGAVAGLVIVLFRLLTERGLVWLGVLPGVERYEALDPLLAFALPAGGGLAIGLLFQCLPRAWRAVGPAHVMAQLAASRGRLPWQNALLQFVGGAASIVTGHSVGREGPVIHVGAASASLLGQWLGLPNNSLRTLVACGVAASIAASFNTPLAGVIFAMEVVMLEYTLIGFTPVILSAVAATSVSRLVFGSDAAFVLPRFELVSLLELPWVLLLGVVIGAFAAAYVAGIVRLDRATRNLPIWLRMTAAGVFVGACARFVPEIMGLGYDTVQLAMAGQLALATLVLIAVTKLAATVVGGGLALPGGLIGPMLVIGACVGGALGFIGHALVATPSADPAFYATLGAATMMGACLHAPLAALMAILELTANPATILPGMAAVTTALLVARVVFRQAPLFVALLSSRGIHYRFDPLALALERVGVAAVMRRAPPIVERDGPRRALPTGVAGDDWLIIAAGGRLVGVSRARDWFGASVEPTDAIRPFASIPPSATLGEAVAQLDATATEVGLVLAGDRTPVPHLLHGLVDRARIDATIREG